MTHAEFQNKIQSMTFREIVLAMVAGLRKQWVRINMHTFGEAHDGVCYGCAATNMICQLIGRPLTPAEIYHEDKIRLLGSGVKDFEVAIDCLRKGDVFEYNSLAVRLGIAQAPAGYVCGPRLDNNYSVFDLDAWERSVA